MNQNPSFHQLRIDCLDLHKMNIEQTETLANNIRRVALEPLRDLHNSARTDGITIDQTFEETMAEVEARIQNLRQEFQYEDSNAFQRVIIEQICTAWVQWFVAGMLLEAQSPAARSWQQNQYFTQRYSLCQNRLSKAIDQLAKLRQIPSGRIHLETLAEKEARIMKQEAFNAKWEKIRASWEIEDDGEDEDEDDGKDEDEN